MADFVNTQAEPSVEFSAEVTKVEASEIGGWIPKTPMEASTITVLEVVARKKKGSDKDDYVVKFKLRGIVCRTYISTLKGVFKSKYGEEGLFVKGSTEGKAMLRPDLMVGYEQTEDKNFPIRMIVSK